MESRYKLTMCRLCLSENEFFVNIFALNDWQGYVAAEIISDLLQFQVSETDAYPHVVCTACLTKLTDFRLFKECCQKSKDTYDDMFVSHESPDKHIPEMVTIKSEEVIIDSSSYEVSEDPLMETEISCGPISLKYEVLPFSRDSHTQVELTLLETHPKYQECLQFKRSQCTSNGDIDVDSCSLSISTNDTSKRNSLNEDIVASSSKTIERLEVQSILPGDYMSSFFQKDINIAKEVKNERRKMEEDIGEEGEVLRRTSTEKEVRDRKEGLECFHCGIVLLSKLSLIKHMKVHGFFNSYDCTICGKVFHFNSKLKRHIQTHIGSKPYKCAECSKCFRRNDYLQVHMRLHTGSKPFKCAECSKCFRRNDHLQLHMRSHTGYKPYKCAECSKCFQQNGNLRVHMRSHTGYKPYICAECSKSFSQMCDLKRHNRIHTGSKPYKCAECSKCFTQNGSLQIHMRIHTGSKPYECTACSRRFTWYDGLKSHMKIHTGS